MLPPIITAPDFANRAPEPASAAVAGCAVRPKPASALRRHFDVPGDEQIMILGPQLRIDCAPTQ
jgi:hypothetical protein